MAARMCMMNEGDNDHMSWRLDAESWKKNFEEQQMLHENTRLHVANHTQDLIALFGWNNLDHLPYNTDLTNYLFLHLKKVCM